jgi:hypothetical protein
MTHPDVEAMLHEYLLEQRQNPIRKSLERLTDALNAHETKDHERHVELIRRLDSHDFRIGTLEGRATKAEAAIEEVEDVTGRFQIPNGHAHNGRKSLVPRDVVRWLLIAALVAGSGGIGALAHWLASLGGGH